MSHPRHAKTLGHLVPTLDETYYPKTLLHKEKKQEKPEKAWCQIVQEKNT